MGKARDIRLAQDSQKIYELANGSPYFHVVSSKGMPASEYLLEFRLRGYLNQEGQTANLHRVKLFLPEQYPFSAPPKFAFAKTLFHPNVYKNGDVCHGWYLNNWNPAIRIDDLIMDVAKMICFKTDSYNLRSPANYNCDKDWIAAHKIPADRTNLEASLLLKTDAQPQRNTIRNKNGNHPTLPVLRKPIEITIKKTTLPKTIPPPPHPEKEKKEKQEEKSNSWFKWPYFNIRIIK